MSTINQNLRLSCSSATSLRYPSSLSFSLFALLNVLDDGAWVLSCSFPVVYGGASKFSIAPSFGGNELATEALNDDLGVSFMHDVDDSSDDLKRIVSLESFVFCTER